jgi:hypothetical protein
MYLIELAANMTLTLIYQEVLAEFTTFKCFKCLNTGHIN